jgi:hypothetical protein
VRQVCQLLWLQQLQGSSVQAQWIVYQFSGMSTPLVMFP